MKALRLTAALIMALTIVACTTKKGTPSALSSTIKAAKATMPNKPGSVQNSMNWSAWMNKSIHKNS